VPLDSAIELEKTKGGDEEVGCIVVEPNQLQQADQVHVIPMHQALHLKDAMLNLAAHSLLKIGFEFECPAQAPESLPCYRRVCPVNFHGKRAKRDWALGHRVQNVDQRSIVVLFQNLLNGLACAIHFENPGFHHVCY